MTPCKVPSHGCVTAATGSTGSGGAADVDVSGAAGDGGPGIRPEPGIVFIVNPGSGSWPPGFAHGGGSGGGRGLGVTGVSPRISPWNVTTGGYAAQMPTRTERQAQLATRRKQVAELRGQGSTFPQIALILGYRNTAAVRLDLSRHLQELASAKAARSKRQPPAPPAPKVKPVKAAPAPKQQRPPSMSPAAIRARRSRAHRNGDHSLCVHAPGSTKKPPPPCGTKAAYNRHLYRGEKPCDACAEACRQAERESRARNGALCSGGCGKRIWWREGRSSDVPTCHECRARRRTEAAATKVVVRAARRAARICGTCGEPIRGDNTSGFCWRTDECRRGGNRCEWCDGPALRGRRTCGSTCKGMLQRIKSKPTCPVTYATCDVPTCRRLFVQRGNRRTCSRSCAAQWGPAERYRIDPEYRARVNADALNRYAGKLGAGEIRSPAALILYLYQRNAGICQLCGEPVTEPRGELGPSADHIIPLRAAIGPPGKHALDNLQLAHLRCNRRKGNRAYPVPTQSTT